MVEGRLTCSCIDLSCREDAQFECVRGFAWGWMQAGVDVLVEKGDCLDDEGHDFY